VTVHQETRTGGYAALLAHGMSFKFQVLYGMELGSVTLKRIGFFVFQPCSVVVPQKIGVNPGPRIPSTAV